MAKIRIGVVPTFVEAIEEVNQKTNEVVKAPYKYYDYFSMPLINKIVETDMIPYRILTNNEELDIDSLDIYDGFIIPGGYRIRKYVYQIINYCIKNNKPLLGICMGCQAIEIYSNLYNKTKNDDIQSMMQYYQEVKKLYDGNLLKKIDINLHEKEIYDLNKVPEICHDVIVKDNTLASRVYQANIVDGPSLHGSTCKNIEYPFIISGYAKDDVPEIIEYDNADYFIIGVQYHPELLNDNTLFDYFKNECVKRKK